MTQEERNLLLKDITARLPYGVKCQYHGMPQIGVLKVVGVVIDYGSPLIKFETPKKSNSKYPLEYYLSEIRPYLFPMSSITEEQKEAYQSLCFLIFTEEDEEFYIDTIESIDWLNAHHFDYRELIEKGLAVDATGKNIY